MEKFLSYGKQNIQKDDIDAVIAVLKSDFMTQGPKIKEFEDAVASYHGAKYAVAFSSGTAALHSAYYASGIGEGDEFITTPITFAATANGGLYLKAIPKFVDIRMDTYCMDPYKIEEAITPKTKAITTVSYGGYPVNVEAIKKLKKVQEHNICIIHDGSHAIGAIRDGHSISDFADMTTLSFHPVKHVATGEGGMVLTNKKSYYEKLLVFRNHGITKEKEAFFHQPDGDWYYEMQDLGFNYRMTDIQCALGITQMQKLGASLIRRNDIAELYEEELSSVAWLKVPPAAPKESFHAYHLYPILVEAEHRKDFFDYMRGNGIGVQVHYIPLHYHPYYRKKFGFKKGMYPAAEEFYSREVSIPMFGTMTDKDVARVIKTIKKFK